MAKKCQRCVTPQRNLNQKIVVQQVKAAPTTDANNEVDLTAAANWETYATRWAAFKSRGGSERFASDMIQAGQTHRVYVRSDSTTRAISPAMRISYDDRIFNILAAVDEDEARQWVVIDCVENK
jgi:SPP1 family predicted phage head-tail adaptor